MKNLSVLVQYSGSTVQRFRFFLCFLPRTARFFHPGEILAGATGKAGVQIERGLTRSLR